MIILKIDEGIDFETIKGVHENIQNSFPNEKVITIPSEVNLIRLKDEMGIKYLKHVENLIHSFVEHAEGS